MDREERLGAHMIPATPLVVVGVDPGEISAYGIHCEDLARDFARGHTIPHDWHWGQCKGVNGAVIQRELSVIMDMVAGFYAANWTNGDTDNGEPLLVLRGDDPAEPWIAYPELHFYVEDQFIIDDRHNKAKRLSMQKDALKTAHSAGRWMAIVETLGFTSHLVLASVWREAQLGKGWGWAKRDRAKRQAITVANRHWGLQLSLAQDHAAEARLIAEYGRVEQEQKRLATRRSRGMV